MLKRMPSLYSMQVFDAIAQRMSFTRAAKDMGITPGAMSYQIRQLEENLGTTLFARQGCGIVLTSAGESLRPTLRRALDEIRVAAERVSRTAPRSLTILLTTYFASRWLLPRLGTFMRIHPELEVRLVPTISNTLQPNDTDITIRWGRGDWPGVASQLLFKCRLTPVCAPGLLLGPQPIQYPVDLHHQTVFHDDEMRVPWTEWLVASGIDDPGTLEGPVSLDANVRNQAAIEGQRFALADALVAGDIAEGRLVAPFNVLLSGYGYYLVHGTDTMRPIAQTFYNWLLTEAGEGPDNENYRK